MKDMPKSIQGHSVTRTTVDGDDFDGRAVLHCLRSDHLRWHWLRPTLIHNAERSPQRTLLNLTKRLLVDNYGSTELWRVLRGNDSRRRHIHLQVQRCKRSHPHCITACLLELNDDPLSFGVRHHCGLTEGAVVIQFEQSGPPCSARLLVRPWSVILRLTLDLLFRVCPSLFNVSAWLQAPYYTCVPELNEAAR